jgi:hypothetical protein
VLLNVVISAYYILLFALLLIASDGGLVLVFFVPSYFLVGGVLVSTYFGLGLISRKIQLY